MGKRDHEINEVAIILVEIFSRLLPSICAEDLDLAGALRLTCAAARFATSVKTSATAYQLHFPCQADDLIGSRLITARNSHHYQVINAANGLPIPKSKALLPSANGEIGEILAVLHPALIKRQELPKSSVLLVKAVVLVKLNQQPRLQKELEAERAAREEASARNQPRGIERGQPEQLKKYGGFMSSGSFI